MPADPMTRASDDDRDTALRLLGEHAAAGRLTPAELDERTDAALTARTLGELHTLTADLPDTEDPPQPAPRRLRLPCCCRW